MKSRILKKRVKTAYLRANMLTKRKKPRISSVFWVTSIYDTQYEQCVKKDAIVI